MTKELLLFLRLVQPWIVKPTIGVIQLRGSEYIGSGMKDENGTTNSVYIGRDTAPCF